MGNMSGKTMMLFGGAEFAAPVLKAIDEFMEMPV